MAGVNGDRVEAIARDFLGIEDEPTRQPGDDEGEEAAGTIRHGTVELVPIGMLKPRPHDWLIRKRIERESFACIFGKRGSAKTFAAIDIALSVGLGRPWCGLTVKQGPVVYLMGEGRDGFMRRAAAWAIDRKVSLETIANAPIFVSRAVPIRDPEACLDLIKTIESAAQLHGTPALFVADTMARNFGPGNENSTEDMGGFVAAMDLVRSKFPGMTQLVVHHEGLAEGRGRGSSVFSAALDAEYRMEQLESGVIVLKNTKMKDDAAPPPMAFRLRTVELPGLFDEEGQQETSAVLEQVDVAEAVPTERVEDLTARILDRIRREGAPMGTTALLAVVKGRKQDKLAALKSLKQSGRVAKDANDCWVIPSKPGSEVPGSPLRGGNPEPSFENGSRGSERFREPEQDGGPNG